MPDFKFAQQPRIEVCIRRQPEFLFGVPAEDRRLEIERNQRGCDLVTPAFPVDAECQFLLIECNRDI